MSWPLMITTIAASAVGMVDVKVAGILGSAAQAAVGVGEQVLYLFMIFLFSISIGTTAIVSRSFGEGDKPRTAYATAQSLSLAVLIGFALTVGAILTAKYFLPLFCKSADVLHQGELYLSLYGLYLIPFSFVCTANAAFRGIGDVITPLLVVTTEVVINIAGDCLTVLGNWPVPNLGVKGIAISGIVGATVGCLLAIYRIYISPLKQSLYCLFPISFQAINKVLTIGIPAALQRLSWATSVLVLFFILSQVKNPTAALAAWSIGIRWESFLFMPLMALSLTVSPLVGQNLGAKQVQRAFQAGWNVTRVGISLMLILSTLLFVGAVPAAQLMSRDPVTVEYTASYLRINALAEPALAVNVILSGALQGAGEARMPMWASIFSHWVVRLPLAWYLALIMQQGPTGVWLAMTISIIISSVIVGTYFQSRKWIKGQI